MGEAGPTTTPSRIHVAHFPFGPCGSTYAEDHRGRFSWLSRSQPTSSLELTQFPKRARSTAEPFQENTSLADARTSRAPQRRRPSGACAEE
jgi:hypothetical protein